MILNPDGPNSRWTCSMVNMLTWRFGVGITSQSSWSSGIEGLSQRLSSKWRAKSRHGSKYWQQVHANSISITSRKELTVTLPKLYNIIRCHKRLERLKHPNHHSDLDEEICPRPYDVPKCNFQAAKGEFIHNRWIHWRCLLVVGVAPKATYPGCLRSWIWIGQCMQFWVEPTTLLRSIGVVEAMFDSNRWRPAEAVG